MIDVVIIAPFIILPYESGNCRFIYLSKLLSEKYDNVNVELISSDFNHPTKSHRSQKSYTISDNFKITLLEEIGYKKNISIKRFYSHYKFSKKLRMYLNHRVQPNVIYCAIPSLRAGYEASQYVKNRGIPFLIDIQDLWPEAFEMIFDVPILKNILFYSFKKQADYIYESADEIIAVSDTYAKRAMSVNQKCNEYHRVYLGSDLMTFDTVDPVEKKDDIISIVYIGTLGSSYDLITCLNALHLLNLEGIKNINFIIMGCGPLENKFKSVAQKLNINSIFTGKLKYESMIGILKSCDIALNPLKKGAAQSIINKVCDYAMAGLPVINSLECIEYQELLKKYNAGINVECENVESMYQALKIMINDVHLRKSMGVNSRKMGIELFNRATTYKILINLIKERGCNNVNEK